MKPIVGHVSNQQVAAALREMADHLQHLGESSFRVAAYRRGAAAVARLQRDLADLFADEGEAGLRQIPGVGKLLARSIARMVRGRRLTKLERAQAGRSRRTTVAQFAGHWTATGRKGWAGPCIPTRWKKCCRRVRWSAAPRAGAWRQTPAGDSRESGVAVASFRSLSTVGSAEEPPVEDLLAIDGEYRRKAAEGRLPRATPRYFNPTGSAWLPVLRTVRNGRSYSAHFANTARSHQLGSFRELGGDHLRHQGGSRSVSGR